jgi:WhiB family transcriptional regulator, redox-sensing transcriptional regulator
VASTADWRSFAACAAAVERGDATVDDWFAEGRGENYRKARKACAECPVRQPCLDEAMLLEEGYTANCYGMAGGLSPDERRDLSRRRRAGREGTAARVLGR